MIKRTTKSLISGFISAMGKGAISRYFFEAVISRTMQMQQEVLYKGTSLIFTTPDRLNKYRADSFASKEPETLDWMDQIPHGSTVWDIGANIGLYSCYLAKGRKCKVFAFEPSVFNLELLARNIFLNGLTQQITIVPLPLSDSLSESCLNMTSTAWGGALSTFGQTYGQDGSQMNKIFEFRTLGISMTDAVELLKIPQPDYIKIDVDGIEHLILSGGISVLSKVKGVLIEIDENFEKQLSDSARYLLEAGLVMKEKRHADMFEGSKFQNCYNQIWVKPA
jgi:FkbM family methyltransferase